MDTALGVHHLEVGGDRLADRAVSGSRTAIRVDVADLDFLVGHAGRLRGGGAGHCYGKAQRERRDQTVFLDRHYFLPW